MLCSLVLPPNAGLAPARAQTATLNAEVRVSNYDSEDISGQFQLSFSGGLGTVATRAVVVAAGARDVALRFNGIKLGNVSLWWPHTEGTPTLYVANGTFVVGDRTMASARVDFGVRTITRRFHAKTRGPQLLVNGKPIFGRVG